MYMRRGAGDYRGDDFSDFGLSDSGDGFLTGSPEDLEAYADYRRREKNR